jgi:hypothetical protein
MLRGVGKGVRNALSKTSELSSIAARIMRCDHPQISAPGPPGRLRGCPLGSPRAAAPRKPQEIYPALAPGLPGAQGVPPPRRLRVGRAPGRPPRPCPMDPPKGGPPRHDLPEGRRAAVQGGPGPQALRFGAVLDAALRAKRRNRRTRRAAGAGTGLESRHISRYYVKRRSKTGPIRRRRLTPSIPRSFWSPSAAATGSWRPGRAVARPWSWCCSVQGGVESGGRPVADRHAVGGRRLRRRVGPRARAGLRHPHRDSSFGLSHIT